MEANSEVAVPQVAAFLVKQKLQSVLDRKVIVDQGLRVQIQVAIDKLKELSDNNEVISDGSFTSRIYRAEDLVEEYFLRSLRPKRKFGSFVKASCPSSPALWRRKRNEIRKALEEVISSFHVTPGTSKRENGASPRTHPWENISHYVRMESETISRLQERDTQDLVNRLTQGDQELVFLPVVGLGGSGKRELVRRVFASERIRNHFNVQACVSVSQDFRYQDFLLNLTEQLTGERLSNSSVDKDPIHVERRIFKSLMDKKYLIVLEDVHGSEDFYKIVSLLPDSKNGSRVVVTSQKDVGEDRFKPTFQVKKLSCEESWKLLLKLVNQRDDRHSNGSSALNEKVMEKCHGVPQAVRLLGGIILCERGIECLEELIDEVPESNEGQAVTNMVKFSFSKLGTELKVCLLYLGLFGDSQDIPVRKLLSLWVGEGFFDGSSMKVSREYVAESCFVELVNRGLIKVTTWKLDGSPKRCRLPSNVHNVLYKKSVETHPDEATGQSIVPLPPNHLRWCADYSGRDIERVSKENHLRSYVSLISGSKSLEAGTIATPNKDIGLVFDTLIQRQGFALLNVLDLECIYKPVLPERIGRLLLLRFLCLRSSAIHSIPSSVGELPLLETLDLKHTCVATLPPSVWRSKSLHHLYVNDVRVDGYRQKRSRDSLTNLQTVTGLYIAGKRAVANILDGLNNLRRVALTCREDSIDAVVRWVLTLPDNLETLKIRCVDGSSKPSEIRLSSMTEHENLHKLYLLGQLQLETVEEASKEKLRKAKSSKIGKLPEKAESRKEKELRKAASSRTEQLEKAERGRKITAESGRGKEIEKLTGSSIAEDVDNSGGVVRNEEIKKPSGLFAVFPKHIRKLTLSMSNLEDDPMQVLGTNFEELIILRLFADSYKGTHMTCWNGWFPKLRCLKLWKLAELKDWKVEQGGMPILHVFEVRMCNNMQNLDGLEHLSGLNKLILTNMPEKFVENVKRHSSEGLHIKPTVYDWKSSYHQAETSNQRSPSQGNEVRPEKGTSGRRDEASTSKLGGREPEKEEIISIHDDSAS